MCRDVLEDGFNVKLAESRAMVLTKVLAVVFGLIGYSLIFVVKSIGGVLEVRPQYDSCTMHKLP